MLEYDSINHFDLYSYTSGVFGLLDNATPIEAIVEVGTGCGLFLHAISQHIKGSHRFIGLDISREIIEGNKSYFKEMNPKLELRNESFDALLNEGIKSFVLIFCGTLEYFTNLDLERLMKFLNHPQFTNIVIAINEPTNLAPGEVTSRPRGNIAWSHNYLHLVKSSNFKVVYENASPASNPKNIGTINVELVAVKTIPVSKSD